MQLSLLQSRLAASLAASLIVLLLYLLLVSPNLAVASELPIRQVIRVEEPTEQNDGLSISYEPDFSLFDRSIIGRAPQGVTALSNNGPEALNLDPGSTACYIMQKKTIFGSKETARNPSSGILDDLHARQEEERDESSETPSKTIYISANTCLQPNRVSPDATTMDPPQLSLFVTNSSKIGCPDSTKDLSEVQWKVFDEGAVTYSLNATGDIYIGISAPNVSSDFKDVYNFEVAVSTDAYYHNYDGDNNSELLWMDSDSSSVLLVTKNLTQDSNSVQQIMKDDPPYQLFVENNSSRRMNGIRHSVCGLERHSLITANKKSSSEINTLVRTGMTTRGPGGLPKQQFYFVGLNSSSSYTGVLVKTTGGTSESKRQASSSLAGGGGTVFKATEFKTLSGTNCKVVTDLDFCDEIQYAVPGNDDKFNNTALAKKYDDYARQMYANFETVVAQIPCENPNDSLYSLARNCTDCKNAYKRWLCTVSIPRCEDFLSESVYGVIRNAGQAFPNGTSLPDDQRKTLSQKPYFNSSRNKFIDEEIQPGPYKEVLPCEDVCYEVVQSCPASIGFRCPQPFMTMFNYSYGQRNLETDAVTCNYPGESRTKFSSAALLLPTRVALGLVPFVVGWAIL